MREFVSLKSLLSTIPKSIYNEVEESYTLKHLAQ